MENGVNAFYSDNPLLSVLFSLYFTSMRCFSPRGKDRSVLGKERTSSKELKPRDRETEKFV